MRAACVIARKARLNSLISLWGFTRVRGFAAESCGQNYRIWTKVVIMEDLGVADKMALFVLGSHAHSLRNCMRSAPKRTYLQLMVAGSGGLQ